MGSKEDMQEKIYDLHLEITQLEKWEILRQSIEKELRKVEDLYGDYFNKTVGHKVIVQDQLIIFVTPSLAKLLGYTQEKMINSPAAFYIHPDELLRVVKHYRERLSGEDAPSVYTTILKHRDGSDVPVEFRAGIITYQGKLADFIIVKDLSGKQNK